MSLKNIRLSEFIKKPVKLDPNTNLVKIRGILLDKNVKHAIIVNKDRPTGVITEKDIARKIYESGSKPLETIKAKNFKSKILFTLTKNNSVQDCAKMMKRHKISLVIILKENKTLEGIITKTDLMSVFITKELSSSIKVSEVMKTKLITVTPSDPILHVESLLIKYGISRIIVKQNQKPAGIITFRDFIPAKIPQWIAESADPKDVQEYKFKKGLNEFHANQMSYLFPFHATDIMTPDPIVIDEKEEIKKAVSLMIKYNISGLPVMKKSKLIGIVTKSDIVNVLSK